MLINLGISYILCLSAEGCSTSVRPTLGHLWAVHVYRHMHGMTVMQFTWQADLHGVLMLVAKFVTERLAIHGGQVSDQP